MVVVGIMIINMVVVVASIFCSIYAFRALSLLSMRCLLTLLIILASLAGALLRCVDLNFNLDRSGDGEALQKRRGKAAACL